MFAKTVVVLGIALMSSVSFAKGSARVATQGTNPGGGPAVKPSIVARIKMWQSANRRADRRAAAARKNSLLGKMKDAVDYGYSPF